MIITKNKKTTKKVIVGVICDVCKKRINEDSFEFQEIIFISRRGGYGSYIGDNIDWEIQICETCFFEKFKNNIHIKTIEEDSI